MKKCSPPHWTTSYCKIGVKILDSRYPAVYRVQVKKILFVRRSISQSQISPPEVLKVLIVLYTEAELRQIDVLFDFNVFLFLHPPETVRLCDSIPPSSSHSQCFNTWKASIVFTMKRGRGQAVWILTLIWTFPDSSRRPEIHFVKTHSQFRDILFLSDRPRYTVCFLSAWFGLWSVFDWKIPEGPSMGHFFRRWTWFG